MRAASFAPADRASLTHRRRQIYTGNEVVAYPFAVQNNNILALCVRESSSTPRAVADAPGSNQSFLASTEQTHQQCGYEKYIDTCASALQSSLCCAHCVR